MEPLYEKSVKKRQQNKQDKKRHIYVNKCQTKNVIYMLGCKKCKAQYIGETHRTLQDRFSEHLGYVRNNHTKKVTGEHFNSKGHKQSDMMRTIIEKIHNNSSLFRKQREKMFISKFNTKYKGMNRITWG